MKNGFSLVELSIVLVILGLLTGGILAGQNLIRAAELRSVSTDFDKLQTAIYTYRDKYFMLPGDGRDAFRFFGTDCAATAAECNGNGNGFMGESIGANTYGEAWMAFKQLALAGLIEGSYTGVLQPIAQPGENFLGSKISQAGFWFYAWGDLSYFRDGCCGTHGGDVKNFIHFGGVAGNWPNASMLTPEEAWNIDTKMDDGRPGTGRLIAPDRSGCSSDDDPNVAEFVLSTTTVECELGLIMN